jgi:hypothetical protein
VCTHRPAQNGRRDGRCGDDEQPTRHGVSLSGSSTNPDGHAPHARRLGRFDQQPSA